jgi:membrane-bound serine protease (ClpP class)
MTALGFMLIVVGAVLVVAEAHMPSGALGIAGGAALIAGGVVVIAALGGGAALAVPVGIGLGAGAAGWTLLIARQARTSRRVRVRAGPESLCGRLGVVRRWSGPSGQVFVEGSLWRARHAPAGDDDSLLREGDHVVVERVNGLTLSVRRAEEWELPA